MSPKTGLELPSNTIIPNITLKSLIQTILSKQP